MAAASIILEKMALNDDETLSEIKHELFKVMDCSGESAYQDPPADTKFNKKTKNTLDLTQDPEPTEAQEQETTTQTDASNYVDLTNTVNSEITVKTKAGSSVSIKKQKQKKHTEKQQI